MKPAGTNSLNWIAIALLALVLAFMGPKESTVMGKLPKLAAQAPAGLQPVNDVPPVFNADRTLVLVTFNKSQRSEADSWVKGLQLGNAPSIAWVRMPVLKDPGDDAIRDALEVRVRAYYGEEPGRTNLLPVFADHAEFMRSANLDDTDHAHVLVLNRYGDILARTAGPFDADRAQALRETLVFQSL